jgi:NADPH:quinone reductase-like Zn-dependent oxidoreductase
VMAGGKSKQIFEVLLLGSWLSEKNGRRLGSISAHMNLQDLLTLKEMLEAGKMAPVIDKRFPLSEVPEAMRYLGTGHARGKVVISVAE